MTLKLGDNVRIKSPTSGREWLVRVVSLTEKKRIPTFRLDDGSERLFPPDWIKEVL